MSEPWRRSAPLMSPALDKVDEGPHFDFQLIGLVYVSVMHGWGPGVALQSVDCQNVTGPALPRLVRERGAMPSGDGLLVALLVQWQSRGRQPRVVGTTLVDDRPDDSGQRRYWPAKLDPERDVRGQLIGEFRQALGSTGGRCRRLAVRVSG